MATEAGGAPGWARTARVGVPLAVGAAVVALRPEILTGTFSSVGSVFRVVALVVAWMGFSWLLRRLITNPAARTAALGIAGVGILWLTVVPYFQNETVDDAFPVVAVPAGPAASFPAVAAPVATPDAPAPEPPVPVGPQKLGSGQLSGLAGHRGSGEAAVYRQSDGSLLVRLEDFDVSNVPSPVVYLVPGANRQSPGGVKLGGLRGNQGNQNFTVPAGTEASGGQTILIWCEAFSVPVAAATATVA